MHPLLPIRLLTIIIYDLLHNCRSDNSIKLLFGIYTSFDICMQLLPLIIVYRLPKCISLIFLILLSAYISNLTPYKLILFLSMLTKYNLNAVLRVISTIYNILFTAKSVNWLISYLHHILLPNLSSFKLGQVAFNNTSILSSDMRFRLRSSILILLQS